MSDWNELLSDARQALTALEAGPELALEDLESQVEHYLDWLQQQAGPVTDLFQARRLAEANARLLRRARTLGSGDRRLAVLASRYFVTPSDGEDDLLSPFGFDDDVEVYNLVVSRLGLPSWRLPIVGALEGSTLSCGGCSGY